VQIRVSKRRARPKPPARPSRKPEEVNPLTLPNYRSTAFEDDEDDFASGNNGASLYSSPEKARDTIDWGITSGNIEQLKSQVVPRYWELLLESVNGIVWITERLYVLQDWNLKGFLKVTSLIAKINFKGMSIQTCVPNG
jgi:hypothetical protein